jgi:hypothetical protein
MSANCPYCGSNVNFGLKFCVVCGHQIAFSQKMGSSSVRIGAREADSTQRIDDDLVTDQKSSKRKSLRFNKGFRSLGQTIMYGFIAGALFFTAIKFALEASFPTAIKRVFGNPLESLLHGKKRDKLTTKDDSETASRPHTKPLKKPIHKRGRAKK